MTTNKVNKNKQNRPIVKPWYCPLNYYMGRFKKKYNFLPYRFSTKTQSNNLSFQKFRRDSLCTYNYLLLHFTLKNRSIKTYRFLPVENKYPNILGLFTYRRQIWRKISIILVSPRIQILHSDQIAYHTGLSRFKELC